MKKISTILLAAAALTLTACGGKSETSAMDEAVSDMLNDTMESTDEEDSTELATDDTPAPDAWTIKAQTAEVEGPLKGIVELEQLEYEFTEVPELDGNCYLLELKFKVLQPQKFKDNIKLYGVLYDEDGNPVVMEMKEGALAGDSDTFLQERPLECFSEGYLQMAIAKGEECTKTSLMLRYEWYPKFEEEKKKFKTFKVFSELKNYGGFDYDNELYQ